MGGVERQRSGGAWVYEDGAWGSLGENGWCSTMGKGGCRSYHNRRWMENKGGLGR